MPAAGEQRVTIGVAGGSASGKTVLAAAIAAEVPSSVVLPQDAYYFDGLGALSNFDHPDAIEWPLLQQHLATLRRGSPVPVPEYDFTTHTRVAGRARSTGPARVVIVEGLHVLQHAPIQRQLDITVFVDTPADVRLIRRLRRDVAERGRTPESVLRQYEDQVRPMHLAFVEMSRSRADLVVDGTQPPGDTIAVVRAHAAARQLAL